jgi:hypothetical protein
VESATPPEVIDAIRAEVSTEVELVASSAEHSSPLEEIPVFTMTTEPGLAVYWVLLPLITQLPPGRPSVYGVKAAAWQVP